MDKKVRQNPKSLGFHMPAEWFFHHATWLVWPSNQETWPTGLRGVQDRFVEIIEALTDGERIYLLIDSEEELRNAEAKLEKTSIQGTKVKILTVPTADAWIRDYGPNFLIRSVGGNVELGCNDWIFNAWGNRYPELVVDSGVPGAISSFLDILRFEPSIVLEGGSIEVNGEGLCMTTRQCLLNANRNPDLREDQIESHLAAYLGIDRVIWLNSGIAGDDTDGHIDQIARFTDASTVVIALEENPESPNFLPLQENYQILVELSKAEQLFEVVPLPTPEPIVSVDAPLPASYTNFYVGNKVVLVPMFNQASDQLALDILGPLFPGRRAIGIDCREIIEGMGALHCLTLQQPYSGDLRFLESDGM